MDALVRMQAAGLALADMHVAKTRLLALDATTQSATETLKIFLDEMGAEKKFLELGLQEIYESPSFEMPIALVPGARELLQELKNSHHLAVVTLGKPGRQLKKMEKAGLDPTFFCKIYVTEERNKKVYYEALKKELSVHPKDVLVCGDKVEVDLEPAKALGFTTVHLKRGRGVHSKGAPDFTITKLSQLKDIIKA